MSVRKLSVCLLLTGIAWTTSCKSLEPIDVRRELGGVVFRVISLNNSSINPVKIQARLKGALIEEFTPEADGTITGIEVADLNGDGFPELYLFVASVGSGGYGSIIAYSSNRNQSLTPIHLQELPARFRAGYRGYDRFSIEGNRLIRAFPTYRRGDSNAAPTGPNRTVAYRLVAEEAGWQLQTE